MRVWPIAVLAFALLAASGEPAEDRLRPLANRHLAALALASSHAQVGSPEGVQERYDAARALEHALVGREAPGCAPFVRALRRLAAAHVSAAEAFDTQRPVARWDALARRRAISVESARGRCGRDRLVRSQRPDPLARYAAGAARMLRGTPWPRPARRDRRLERRLETALRSFPGEASAWVHELRTGRAAGVDAGDRYPAASTVKLAVLVAALARFGADAGLAHDLETMTRWSSNLAANRLWRLAGGDSAVEETLRRLGADASTYPGPYRAGSSRAAPPLVSGRVTTARDLGRILQHLHGAAAGRRADLDAARLTRREARVALGLLLRADDAQGAIDPPVPAARKHGWISSARHTAAVLYGPRGPVVVVLLTYRPGLEVRDARALGRRVARIALSGS